MPDYSFHPDAQAEYERSIQYYLDQVSPIIAAAFLAEVEEAIRRIVASPTTWPVMDHPEVRRYLVKRFPYALYYRWEANQSRVSIYAVMHLSRRPGYWRSRVS